MAQIKPMPVHIREYYKAMKEAYTQKKDEANECFTYFEKDYEINGGEKEFQTEELEVFKII